MTKAEDEDVHTEHCCIHQCKYGSADCTVTRGLKPQSFPCEDCDAMTTTEREAVIQLCLSHCHPGCSPSAHLLAYKILLIIGERKEAEEVK